MTRKAKETPEELAERAAELVQKGEATITVTHRGRSVTLGGGKKGKVADAAHGGERPKLEKYEVVPEDDPAWKLLEKVREASHSTLEDAIIALVYENGIKSDHDGHVVLGRCKKTGRLDRLYREHDFTILLNKATWAEFPEPIRLALLDHELCHAGRKTNAKGDPVYYVRKHDLEDFHEVVRRHGIWTSNLKAFIDAALQREQIPLFSDETRKLAIEAVRRCAVEKAAREMAS